MHTFVSLEPYPYTHADFGNIGIVIYNIYPTSAPAQHRCIWIVPAPEYPAL